MDKEFENVVNFHRHLCLDIAVGYRAAKAAMPSWETRRKT